MSDRARRVVLLARPGVARDRMREALVQAGADIVLEADPTASDPAAVSRARPEVVLIVLDTATDEALDRFDGLLSDPKVDVFFEEAELAMGREGWDAARWVRHLRAKLHHADSVLPPGGETAASIRVAPSAPPAIAARASIPSAPRRAAARAGDDAGHGSDWSLPDAVDIPLPSELELAGIGIGGDAGRGREWDLSEAADIPLPSEQKLAGIGFGGDAGGGREWDLSEAADIPLPSEQKLAAIGFGGDAGRGSEWDLSEAADIPLPTELELAAIGPGSNAGRGREWDLSESEATIAPLSDLDLAAIEIEDDAPRVSVPPPLPALELELVDEPPTGILIEGLELEQDSAAAAHLFQNDMTDLHSRIASLELVADEAPVSVRGAVLVLAGIGGPDAVRQLLGALPEGFPRAVVVQQRLDGGHYDRLVAQMQRATALPVRLAAAGEALAAATVYILPSSVGVQGSGQGLVFNDSPGDLPSALPAGDSAVLMLSGSDPAQVDAVMKLAAAGALVAGQALDGCYDASAPAALAARGGQAGKPQELARLLVERWH